jgi:hypothetical protein
MEGLVGRESAFPHSGVSADAPLPSAHFHGRTDLIAERVISRDEDLNPALCWLRSGVWMLRLSSFCRVAHSDADVPFGIGLARQSINRPPYWFQKLGAALATLHSRFERLTN